MGCLFLTFSSIGHLLYTARGFWCKMILKVSIGVGPAKQFQLIPISWVENLDVVLVMNYGLHRYKNKTFKIFYSEDVSATPDFQLGVLPQIKPKQVSCYEARLLKAFGKHSIILSSSLHAYHD